MPTVALVGLEPAEVTELYAIARKGTRLVDPDASFWDYEANADLPLIDALDAGLRVTRRLAAPFAFAVEGLTWSGVQLPALGFQIFESVFAVHYQMGPAWTPESVFAFFGWLRAILARTRGGSLDLSIDGPPDPVAFHDAWMEFIRN